MQRINISTVIDFEPSTGLNSLNVLIADKEGQAVSLEFSYETIAMFAELLLVSGRQLTPPINLPGFAAADVGVFPRENGDIALQFMDDRGTIFPVLVSKTSSMRLNVMANCMERMQQERLVDTRQ